MCSRKLLARRRRAAGKLPKLWRRCWATKGSSGPSPAQIRTGLQVLLRLDGLATLAVGGRGEPRHCSRGAPPSVCQGSLVRCALRGRVPACWSPAAAAAAGHWSPRSKSSCRWWAGQTRRLQHYASRRDKNAEKAEGKHKDFSIHSAGRVWDLEGILPQRGQVVERPRLAPRRLQRRRRRRLVGAEPDRDAREADRGKQLELDQ